MATKSKSLAITGEDIPEEFDLELKNAITYWLLEIETLGKGERRTKDDIASLMGIGRSTLYTWLDKWDENGVLRQAQQYVSRQFVRENSAATAMIAAAWPQIMSRMIDVATGQDTKHAITAAKFVWEIMEKTDLLESLKPMPLDDAAAYAGNQYEENPRIISKKGRVAVQVDNEDGLTVVGSEN